jgi:hypothetical protein
MPDLVIAVALKFEEVGLSFVPHSLESRYSIPKRYGAYRLTSTSRRFRHRFERSERRTL